MQTEKQVELVPGHEMGDITLAMELSEKLNKHYPGHLWSVHVSDEPTGAYVVIRNLGISDTVGYFLKLARIYADIDRRCVMRAGGEMLERAGLSQERWDGQDAKHIEGIEAKHQPLVFNGERIR